MFEVHVSFYVYLLELQLGLHEWTWTRPEAPVLELAILQRERKVEQKGNLSIRPLIRIQFHENQASSCLQSCKLIQYNISVTPLVPRKPK